MIQLKHKLWVLPLQNSLKCLLVWCIVAWCLFGLLLQGNLKTLIQSSRLRFLPSNGSDSSQEEMLPTFDLDCTFTKKRAITDIKMGGHSIDYGPDDKGVNNEESNGTESSIVSTDRRPLKVFVLLHSHVDPGWLRTFDQYYGEKVKAILTKAVYYLSKDPSLRFIWSEISYLQVWWQAATSQQRNNLLKVIKSGQLEITGGAWVMTDEATPYYWASIDNMIEGHQFLADELGVRPSTSWSVDPFGHGVMMPYLLRLSGVDKMAIGRVNSAQKQKLRQNKHLMFRWRQMWDQDGVTDNWVHMLPRTYYTTVDSCGPDPEVCCRFEFGPSARSSCNARAVVTDDTVDGHATKLVDQYRKLSNWYQANTSLVVVGDDFYFSRDDDWIQTSKQYSALFKHINMNEDKFGMQVQFGTLSEYFAHVGQPSDYPTLSGDFFPYMDGPGGHPYWTGFFTTRPYFKRLERIIESRLRGTDLLSAFSLGAGDWHKTTKPRRDLALFQHHDAITGTSTLAVMNDYLHRLLMSLTEIMKQQAKLASSVLGAKGGNSESVPFSQTETIPKGTEGLSSVPLTIAPNGRIAIVVYNQLARQYTRSVRVVVQVPTVKVVRKNDRAIIPAQINPVIVDGAIIPDLYELIFLADLDSLSLTMFELHNDGQQPESTIIAKIGIDSRNTAVPESSASLFQFEVLGALPFLLQNDYLTIGFDAGTGCLQFVKSTESQKASLLEMSFATYGDRGGAYTFTPYEAAKPLNITTSVTVIRGPIMSAVHTTHSALLQQTVAVFKAAGALGQGIHVTLRPNMTSVTGLSLVTRIRTQASLGHTFYTDVNGLYLMERTHNKTLPIEANYYPVASAAVIQNRDTRITLLSGQPMGAASEMAGSLEAMVDRTVGNDDGKGLSFGQASNSPPSELQYTLLFEPRKAPEREERSIAYHSLIAQQALEQLFHPPTVFLASATADLSPSLSLAPALPCDIELVNVRPLIDGSLLLLLRRLTFDCAANGSGAQCANNQDSMEALIDALDAKTIEETTLTGTKTLSQVRSGAEILAKLGPMDLRAYRLRR